MVYEAEDEERRKVQRLVEQAIKTNACLHQSFPISSQKSFLATVRQPFQT